MTTITANVSPAFWVPKPSLPTLGQALMAFTGTRFYLGGWLFVLGAGAVIVIALWSALWVSGALPEGMMRRWLLVYIGATLLLPFAISFFLPQMFVPWRYTIVALPPFIWLAARGWNALSPRLRGVTAVVLLALLAAADWQYFTRYRKGNIRDAVERFSALPDSRTVLILPAYLRDHWIVYDRRNRPMIAEAGIDEIVPQLAGHRQAVFVTLDVPNVVKDAMDARYPRISEERLPADFHLGLVIAVYRVD